MAEKFDMTPSSPEGKDLPQAVQTGPVQNASSNEASPEGLELFTAPILQAQNFSGDNLQLNLEYQRLFYTECLKGDRAASWIALVLIIISVLLILGSTITALLLKESADLLNAAGGIFTGILGGYVYNLHIKSRIRLDKVARELSSTARELSSVGKIAVAKHYIDQLSDPTKRDEQLEKLIDHILQPNLENED